MKARLGSNEEEIRTNLAKIDATLEEMKEKMLSKMEGRIEAIMRSLRAFDLISSPG